MLVLIQLQFAWLTNGGTYLFFLKICGAELVSILFGTWKVCPRCVCCVVFFLFFILTDIVNLKRKKKSESDIDVDISTCGVARSIISLHILLALLELKAYFVCFYSEIM